MTKDNEALQTPTNTDSGTIFKTLRKWALPFVLLFQLGKDGCLNTVISIRRFQLYRSYARMYTSLNVESTVTENGTGNTKWRLGVAD